MKPKGYWVYRVHYKKQVIKFLQKQNVSTRRKIVDFFDDIKKDPKDFKTYDVKPLQGINGFFRLRVSKFRIIFSLEDDRLVIEVIKAKSRGDVYK